MTATDETHAPSSAAAPPRTLAPALLVAAILLLALNLRGPIVAVSPVTGAIRADLGIDAGTAGLLTSLPVLCFGLATPLASALLARTGLARGVLVALGVLLAGTVVRSLDGLPAAIAGTLLIGAAITVGNVAVPVVIGRDLPRQAGAVLGMYTAALNIGSMITLSLTVPIAGASDWRFALASWGLLVVVAAGVWWWATRSLADAPAERSAGEAPVAGPVWWRRPVVWGLMIAFAGQAFAYYGVTAWLPLLLGDRLGMSETAAGVSSSIFQIAAVVGAFGVPVLLRLCPSPRTVVAVVSVAWAALPLGLLLAPHGWAVWCALGGAAQGGGITVIFSLVVRRARDLTENRRMSALVQGGGYTIAATGPSVVGAVHEATGGWSGPLLVVFASVLVLFTAGLAASRRTV
ncbi:MFS transporter [Pseudonocardia sp. RS11V-5]|uniref:MFS transporter n=1 Tax=Pseudonocardia terrae TaxID=2905831 RepID=UPI001E3F9854|nr:MFS transporter [Pseudonocardia terrae]MCE3553400.1 MFS transporter [Pseudonocardia terrae]